MKISDLEIFCTVAREKSFIRAANLLYLSQSAVTQHIKKIEQELGFELFERSKHYVRLSAQGEIMNTAAQDIIKRYLQALSQCHRDETSGISMEICYVGNSSFTFLPDTIRCFRETYTVPEITTRRIRPDQVVSVLESSESSLVFTPYDIIAKYPQYRFYPVFEDRHYCVMNRSNPFSVRNTVELQDLQDKTLFLPSKPFMTGHIETLLTMLQSLKISYKPAVGHNIDNVLIQLLSSSEDAFAVMPGFTVPYHTDLCAVELTDGIKIKVGFACSRQPDNAGKAFLETALRVLERKETGSQ